MKIVHAGIVKAIVVPVAIGAIFALLQQGRVLAIAGVNPNLTLAALAVFAALAPGFVNYAFLFLSAALFLQPLPMSAGFAFAAIAAALYALRLFAPWRAFARLLLSLIAASFAFYALADSRFLLNAPATVAAEAGYNTLLGILCYTLARGYYRLFFGPYEAPE